VDSGDGHLSSWSPAGEPGRGLNTGDVERRMKEDSRSGHHSPRELFEGNLEGGFLHW
jgi:hypothetical protein